MALARQSGVRIEAHPDPVSVPGRVTLTLGQQACVAQIRRSLAAGQRVVLATGEPGVGKSVVATEIAAAPPPGFVAVLNGFWWRGTDPVAHFRDALAAEQGPGRPLVVCDGADGLEASALARLPALAEAKDGAVLILGTPALAGRLAEAGLALPPMGLVALAPMTRRESDAFLRARLLARGLDPAQVSDATLAAMHDSAKGNPRRLRALIETRFLGLATEGGSAPDPAAAAPVPPVAPPPEAAPGPRRLRPRLLAGSAAAALVLTVWAWMVRHPAGPDAAETPPPLPASALPVPAAADPAREETERRLAEALALLTDMLAARDSAEADLPDPARRRVEDLPALRAKSKADARPRPAGTPAATVPAVTPPPVAPILPAAAPVAAKVPGTVARPFRIPASVRVAAPAADPAPGRVTTPAPAAAADTGRVAQAAPPPPADRPAGPAAADPELREALMALLRRDREEIQQRLLLAGFDPRGVDGFFGAATRTAIAAWQQARGLAPTGYLDPAQVARLKAETGALALRVP